MVVRKQDPDREQVGVELHHHGHPAGRQRREPHDRGEFERHRLSDRRPRQVDVDLVVQVQAAAGFTTANPADPHGGAILRLTVLDVLDRQHRAEHHAPLAAGLIGDPEDDAFAKVHLSAEVGPEAAAPRGAEIGDPAVGQDLESLVVVGRRLGGIDHLQLLPGIERIGLHEVEYEPDVGIALGDRVDHAREHLGVAVQPVDVHRQGDEQQEPEREIEVARPVLPVEERRPDLALAGAAKLFLQSRRCARARLTSRSMARFGRGRDHHRMPPR